MHRCQPGGSDGKLVPKVALQLKFKGHDPDPSRQPQEGNFLAAHRSLIFVIFKRITQLRRRRAKGSVNGIAGNGYEN